MTTACGASSATVPLEVAPDGSPADASMLVDGSPSGATDASPDATTTADASPDAASPSDAPDEGPTADAADDGRAPSVADNPPVPTGYKLMMQSEVTPDMTAWAVSILDDPTTYPMFSTAMMTFGTVMVLARVEWHPPDFQNSVVHRGVTLYEPIQD
jgi:hypothetical protein